MKLTFKEKAKLFWERNKEDILYLLGAAGVVSVFGAGCAVVVKKERERREAEVKVMEDLVKSMLEARKEAETAPENQLGCGGYVLPGNDDLDDPNSPNLLANSVPLSSMGAFGQEICERLNREYSDQEFAYFDPETAVADVMIDFGHEVWRMRNPEEAAEESQEKQAS